MPSSLLTSRYRIKDATSGQHLFRMARPSTSCGTLPTNGACMPTGAIGGSCAVDLINLTAGTSKELGLHTDTLSEVCREYATRRRQCKKIRLQWRSRKRSLGWVPFKGRGSRSGRYGHLRREVLSLLALAATRRAPQNWELHPGGSGALVHELPVRSRSLRSSHRTGRDRH